MTELARSLLLVFLGVIFGAIGLTAALPLALVGAVMCVAVLVIPPVWSWSRHRETSPPTSTRLDPEEDPSKRDEREAIQRDARRTAGHFRAMHRLSHIEDTPGGDRLEWQEKYLAPLQKRLKAYCRRWNVKVPDAAAFVATNPPIEPEWLDAMARDADVIVWGLDHER